METPSDGITFTYDCTRAERREGSTLANAPVKGTAEARKANYRGVLTWLVFVALSIVFMVWMKHRPALPGNAFVARSWAASDGEADPNQMLLIVCSVIALSGAGCVVAAVSLALVVNRRYRRRCNGRVQMSILPEGFVESRGGVVTTTRWASFRGAEQGKHVLILRSNELQSVVIPKRLLGSDAEAARVFELMQARTTKAALPASSAFPVIQS